MTFRGGRMTFFRYLSLSAILALLLFLSSLGLPQGGMKDCESSWHPCLSFQLYTSKDAASPGGEAQQEVRREEDRREEEKREEEKREVLARVPPECPGQSFQVWRLLVHLRSTLGPNNDILLEPYLHSWDELIRFMESLGTIVSFFSQKVKVKVALIRELSLKHSIEVHGKHPSEPSGLQTPPPIGLHMGPYHSVSSMVEAELKADLVGFSRRRESGCRTLLRLHRSLQWLMLLLQGLAEGPDRDGQYRTPGELCREAYVIALAPHHPWLLRQAAELVFIALPDRRLFLDIVCVTRQEDAPPILHTLIHALMLVHTCTQTILEENNMLLLP